MNTTPAGAVRPPNQLSADVVPTCVPAFVRAAMQRGEARGYSFAFSKPDFAGQLHIAVNSSRGDTFTWSIVGNVYERDVSYLTFVERLEHGARVERSQRMQSAQEGSWSILGR